MYVIHQLIDLLELSKKQNKIKLSINLDFCNLKTQLYNLSH